MPTNTDNLENMNILQIFSYLDCSTPEIKTFQALLGESNGATVLLLQKKLNIPRASIYDQLGALIEKGLVRKGQSDTGSLFFAESRDVLLSLFREQVERVTQASNHLETYLSHLPNESTYTPRFSVIESAGAAQNIFHDILRSREEMSYWFWPVKEMLNTVSNEVFESFVRERMKRNMTVQILWPKKQEVALDDYPVLGPNDKREQLREIRVLQEPIDTTMTYVIYGNKVAYISSKRENYGFIIDSAELAHMTKSQFQYMWKLARPL